MGELVQLASLAEVPVGCCKHLDIGVLPTDAPHPLTTSPVPLRVW
ncbi:MAG: hypothetical protein AABZ35_00775 [Gemmatimonadota bacterium]